MFYAVSRQCHALQRTTPERSGICDRTSVRRAGDSAGCSGETSDKTPAYQRELLEQQRLSAARQALESDDCLNALLTDFDAIVVPESVRPPLVEL